MKKWIAIGVMAILCPLMNYAQGLREGDPLPIPLEKITGIKDLKGKYIIIDHFATWCIPCIRALPHLDSLQKKYADRLQVIAVTREPRSVLQVFFSKHKALRSLSLPFITSDTLLHNWFPHRGLPHEVILSPEHHLLTTTHAAEINTSNVERLLATGSAAHFRKKKDALTFSTDRPLVENLNDPKMIRSQSIISSFIPGAGTKHGIRTDDHYTRFFFINMPLLDLLQLAHDRPTKAPYRLEVDDMSRFTRGTLDWNEWAPNNAWCYEISLPVGTSRDEMRRLMRADLESRFGLSTTILSPASGEGTATLLFIKQHSTQ